ncbi:MAG: ATP-binding protein [Verrucomicrobiota bacterium]
MRSLTSQLIGLMLVALLLSQVLFYLINNSERDRSLRTVRQDELLARANAVARLVGVTEEAVHPEVLRAAGTALSRYWLSPGPPADALTWEKTARDELLRALPSAQPENAREVVPNSRVSEAELPISNQSSWTDIPPKGRQNEARLLELEQWNGIGYATVVRPGLWLNAVFAKPELIASPIRYYISLAVTALLLSLLAVLAARRVGRPLQRLTESAERIGRGEDVPAVPEEGADDIRRTAIAFNQMQSRLRRFVEDRTRMIADISHDLRTPVTLLRLQAEFVSDPDTKEKMISTLDEMQAMTEATLAFAKEEASSEPSRIVDMNSMLESVCADLSELGWDVGFMEGERVPWHFRPESLRRAIRNVIENAVRYGERARVRLERAGNSLNVIVDDDGPGIPEADFEKVFAPFVRLENSRNPATGGVGLGLAITRTIMRSHGGDVVLSNRPEGGLRVLLSFPEI